jgi:hypothetical protein
MRKNRRYWSELEELGEGLEARSWGENEERMEDRNKERDKEKGDKEEHGKGMGKSLRVRGGEGQETGMGKRDWKGDRKQWKASLPEELQDVSKVSLCVLMCMCLMCLHLRCADHCPGPCGRGRRA